MQIQIQSAKTGPQMWILFGYSMNDLIMGFTCFFM